MPEIKRGLKQFQKDGENGLKIRIRGKFELLFIFNLLVLSSVANCKYMLHYATI